MIKRVTKKPTTKVLKGNATFDKGIGGGTKNGKPKAKK